MDRNTLPQVELNEFLDVLFPGAEGCEVCLTSPGATGWDNVRAWGRKLEEIEAYPGDWYVCSSLVAAAENNRRIDRKRENLRVARVFMLDDIGTKAAEPPVKPSCIMETSPGNFQWVYRLENTLVTDEVEYARYDALLKACADAGYTDPLTGSAGRVIRIPGSVNTKREIPFTARIVYWSPDELWTLESLADALGIQLRPMLNVRPSPSLTAPLMGDAKDEVYDWLLERDLVAPIRGSFAKIACPWEAEHTPGRDDQAGYSPLGYGTEPLTRSFKCFHGHCATRTASDFLQWVEEQGGPAADVLGVSDLTLQAVAKGLGKVSREEKFEMFREALPTLERSDLPEVNWSGKNVPAASQNATQANVNFILNRYGVSPRMNVNTREVEMEFLDPRIRELTTYPTDGHRALVDASLMLGMGHSRRDFEDNLITMASNTRYHPMQSWVISREWDGRNRLAELANTVNVGGLFNTIWPIYLRKWLLQGVQAVFGWEHPKQMAAVLTLSGTQGIGKGRWFSSLVPKEYFLGECSLDLRGFAAKDSIMRATSAPIVELAELDTTFRQADIGAIKSFLAQTLDVYRPPYGRQMIKWPRATSFCASVNRTDFLMDETGSRRFWPVEVDSIQQPVDLDTQQLWREAYELWAAGERWWLDQADERTRVRLNKDFNAVTSSVELGESYLDRHSSRSTAVMSATEFALLINVVPSPKNLASLAHFLTERLGARKQIAGRRNVWDIPTAPAAVPYLKEVKQ